MDRTYDIFERFPDESVVWHSVVSGLEDAIVQMKALAAQSHNEFFIFHTATQTTVARVNVPKN